MVESDRRKSIFLDEVIRQTNLDASTINKRIEEVENKNFAQPVVITARALADMNKIFEMLNSFVKPDLI